MSKDCPPSASTAATRPRASTSGSVSPSIRRSPAGSTPAYLKEGIERQDAKVGPPRRRQIALRRVRFSFGGIGILACDVRLSGGAFLLGGIDILVCRRVGEWDGIP